MTGLGQYRFWVSISTSISPFMTTDMLADQLLKGNHSSLQTIPSLIRWFFHVQRTQRLVKAEKSAPQPVAKKVFVTLSHSWTEILLRFSLFPNCSTSSYDFQFSNNHDLYCRWNANWCLCCTKSQQLQAKKQAQIKATGRCDCTQASTTTSTSWLGSSVWYYVSGTLSMAIKSLWSIWLQPQKVLLRRYSRQRSA